MELYEKMNSIELDFVIRLCRFEKLVKFKVALSMVDSGAILAKMAWLMHSLLPAGERFAKKTAKNY